MFLEINCSLNKSIQEMNCLKSIAGTISPQWKYVSDFGKNNSNFTWTDTNPIHVRDLDEIKKTHLGIVE